MWSAIDRRSGRQVAIKLVQAEAGNARESLREIAALRALRLPGVVPLLDGGVDEAGAWLVMPLVDGTPFPGATGSREWSKVGPRLRALLMVLRRVQDGSGWALGELRA